MAKKTAAPKKAAPTKTAPKKTSVKATANKKAPAKKKMPGKTSDQMAVSKGTVSALAGQMVAAVPRVNITLPSSPTALVKCDPGCYTGSICATGTVVTPMRAILSAISGKIYPDSTPLSDIPLAPPGDATPGSVSGTSYSFTAENSNLIPEAAAGDADPYPGNIAVIWATWSTSPPYGRNYVLFGGIRSDHTDCDSMKAGKRA